MKYCLFDGGDVVGPFSAEQLLLRPGFGSHSLVCPEEHSDEEAYWKEAHAYAEFGFDPRITPKPEAAQTAVTAAQSEQFLKEMDSVMSELSSFSVSEKAASAPLPSAVPEPAVSSAQAEQVPHNPPAEIPASAPAPAAPLAQEGHIPPDEVAPSIPEPAAPIPAAEPKPAEQNAPRKISSLLMQASKEMRRDSSKSQPAERKTDMLHLQPQAEAAAAPSLPSVPEPEEKQTEPAVNPAVQPDPETEVVARTVSQMSPIEEYFNTMKSGDLGNILGIPDPKANSDLNLARVLEKQFEKTEPGIGRPMAEGEDPFDEFTSEQKPEEVDESLFASTPEEADRKTEAQLKKDLSDLQSAEPLSVAGQPVVQEEQEEEDTEPPAPQELIVPEQDDDPNDKTVKTILEGTLRVDTLRQEIPEPIKDVPTDEKKLPDENAQDDLLKERVIKQQPAGKVVKMVFLGLGVLVLLTGVYLNWTHGGADETSVPSAPEPEQTSMANPDPGEPAISARQAVNAHPAVQAEPQDPVERAKQIVQDHLLDKGRGTVETYLSRRYAKELASGYAAVWSAEPLHRDVYVVKYRLAKTRKEPIVYIFQADTGKNKLTGALNNITLDLVGKIR